MAGLMKFYKYMGLSGGGKKICKVAELKLI